MEIKSRYYFIFTCSCLYLRTQPEIRFSSPFPFITCNIKQGKSEGFDRFDRPSNLAQILSKSSIFQPLWPCNLMNELENRAPLLYYIKLCASFEIQRWIQTEVTVWKCSIRIKIGDFIFRVTLKFDGWPWKTKGHLFYTASSFVHHFIAISEFKLEL